MPDERPFECPACRCTHHRCWACGHLVEITALVDKAHHGRCMRDGQYLQDSYLGSRCAVDAKPAMSKWSAGQARHVQRLMAQLPDRPWWVAVCPKDRPNFCVASPTLVMAYHHTTWHSMLPPCCDECACTVKALTPAEARRFK